MQVARVLMVVLFDDFFAKGQSVVRSGLVRSNSQRENGGLVGKKGPEGKGTCTVGAAAG